MSYYDLMSHGDNKDSLDLRGKRLGKTEARKLVAEIVTRFPQNVIFRSYVNMRMGQRTVNNSDVMNVLKSPASRIVKEGEFKDGSYRYRLETKKMVVVVTFLTKSSLVVVTCWRIGK